MSSVDQSGDLKPSDKDAQNQESTDQEEQRNAATDDSQTLNSKVHSANSWETADLGDSKRNEKFLRLMGAAKKEHHGKFVIGDHDPVHVRKRQDNEQLEGQLTEQYEQSMEHRLAGGYKGHLGLGFHPEEKSEGDDKKEVQGEEGTKDAAGEKEEEKGDAESIEEINKTDDEKVKEKEERKREADEDSPIDAKKMKFVKSSS